MIRFALLILTLALSAWLAFAMPAGADETAASETGAAEAGLTLRDSVMVNDDVVRLGDLFNEPLSMGDAPVAQAPLPGQTIVLDNRFLRSLIRAYSLDWAPASKYQRVLVARAAQKIDPAQVTS